jgi:YgiT-type zinc finger domain-containing protein
MAMAYFDQLSSPALGWIQERILKAHYYISEHVIRFIVNGKISIWEIEAALESGTIVEVRSNRQKRECCLVRGRTKDTIISVLCAKCNDGRLAILLIYMATPPRWDEFDRVEIEEDEFMSDQNNRCFFCGGEIKSIVVGNFDYRLDGELFVVKNVPAGLCLECDEKYVSAHTAKKINQLVESGTFKGTERVRVVSYQ